MPPEVLTQLQGLSTSQLRDLGYYRDKEGAIQLYNLFVIYNEHGLPTSRVYHTSMDCSTVKSSRKTVLRVSPITLRGLKITEKCQHCRSIDGAAEYRVKCLKRLAKMEESFAAGERVLEVVMGNQNRVFYAMLEAKGWTITSGPLMRNGARIYFVRNTS